MIATGGKKLIFKFNINISLVFTQIMFYIVVIFFLYFKHVHCEYEGEYENAIPVSER